MPIEFSCTAMLELAPEVIAARILEVEEWSGFTGYGFLPGIEQARFEQKTPEVVGSRIHVTNTDGSTHVEEIIAWDLPDRIVLKLQEFTPPLSRIATDFVETWSFQPVEQGTRVVRSFQLHARTAIATPMLWVISLVMRRAIDRHLRTMAEAV